MLEPYTKHPSLRAHLMGMLAIFAGLFLALTLFLYLASRSLFSEALRNELSGDLAWMASLAVGDPGLLSVPSRADSLVKAVAGYKSFRVTLVDGEGRVLADSHVPLEEVGRLENHRERPEFQAARATGKGHAWRYSRTLGMDMLYVAHRLPDGAYLRMAAGPRALGSFQRAAALVFTLFLALFLVAAFAVTWWMSRAISSPLLHLSDSGTGALRWNARFREAEVLNRAFERYVAEIRKLAGEVARERDTLRGVLDQLEEGLILLATDGTVRAANPASLRLLGLAPGSAGPGGEGLRGRNLGEAVKQPALAAWAARAYGPDRTPVLHLDKGPDSPFDLLCHMGSLRGSATPGNPDDTEGGWVLTLLDITEFRHLDRVKSEFVANASHELKTPLSSIKGYAESLLEGALEDGKVRKSFVEKIHSNALRLERLIQDLLHLSRLEANTAPRETEPLPLRAYAAAAAVLHQGAIDGAGLRFENHVPDDARVHMEPRDLELILNNLVGNAVRYNKPAGKIKIGVERAPNVPGLALYVKDTGIGIPAEMLPRIFERFYRADASRARKDGTGLGLAIVKHAAHKYGMAVRAESVPGEGSRFLVDIPETVIRGAKG